MLSNSNASSRVYREDFWYDGEILQKGLPRNDRLFNFTNEDVKSVRARLGIEDDVKVEHGAASYTRPEEVEEFVTKTSEKIMAFMHIRLIMSAAANRLKSVSAGNGKYFCVCTPVFSTRQTT